MTIQILKRGTSPILPVDHAITSNFISMEDCLKNGMSVTYIYMADLGGRAV